MFIRLPAFRDLPALAGAATVTVLACTLLYYVPQHWHVGSPTLLPLTPIDRWIAFLPLTGLVYFAVFPLLAITFLALRDGECATRFLYANLLAQVAAALVFTLFPTTFPREAFPLPAGSGPLAAALVEFCRSADLPLNCLPSLHVSTVVLCLATLRHCTPGGRRAVPLMLPGGLALIASTLTFKQHYVFDVLAGAALGAACWWLCFRWRGLVLAD